MLSLSQSGNWGGNLCEGRWCVCGWMSGVVEGGDAFYDGGGEVTLSINKNSFNFNTMPRSPTGMSYSHWIFCCCIVGVGRGWGGGNGVCVGGGGRLGEVGSIDQYSSILELSPPRI